ncbi:MAG: OmpA family protein, partial [Polyangiaceae bacterium]
LQEIVDLFKADSGIKRMSIDGHTDNKGAADMNKRLSQNRANSVMQWLVSHGITQDRLEAHGYGMEKPIDSNDTDAGRQANRRVEFKILDEEDANKVQKNNEKP